VKTFVVQPFDQKVGVTTNWEEFLKHDQDYALVLHKKKLIDDEHDPVEEKDLVHCLGMTGYWKYQPRDEIKFLIYIKNKKDTSLIFHESLHAAHYVMEHCAQPIDMDSTEVQAYLMEFIASNVMRLLGK